MHDLNQAKCDGFLGKELCVNRNECLRFNRVADDLLQEWVQPKLLDNGKCNSFLKDYAQEKYQNRWK